MHHFEPLCCRIIPLGKQMVKLQVIHLSSGDVLKVLLRLDLRQVQCHRRDIMTSTLQLLLLCFGSCLAHAAQRKVRSQMVLGWLGRVDSSFCCFVLVLKQFQKNTKIKISCKASV